MTPPPLSRWRRAATASLVGLGAGVTFAAALALGVGVHLDLPLTRAVVTDVTNRVLAGAFAGEVRIGHVEVLRPDAITIASFTAGSVDEGSALRVERVAVAGRWLPAVLRFATTRELSLPPVTIERVDVDIAEGGARIARAFEPRSRPEEPSPPPATGPTLRVVAPRLSVGEARVHGELAPGQVLDATLSDARFTVDVGAGHAVLELVEGHIEEPALAGAPLRGQLACHLHVHLDEPAERPRASAAEPAPRLAMWATAAVTVGTLPVALRGRLSDGELEAEVTLPRVGAEELAPWVPHVPLTRPASGALRLWGDLAALRLEAEVRVPGADEGAPAEVLVTGHLAPSPAPVAAPEIVLDVRARHLDASALGQRPTDVNADARLRARITGADTEVLGLLRVAPSTVAGEAVGPLQGTARASRAGVDLALVFEEPGAGGHVELSYRGSDGALGFAARTDVDLAKLERLRGLFAEPLPTYGKAAVNIEGTFAAGILDATTRAEVTGLLWPERKLAVGAASLDGRLAGPLERLALDAQLRGGALTVGAEAIPTFSARATGPLTAPEVRATARLRGREVTARARLDPKARSARAVELGVTHGGATVTTKVDRVWVDGAAVAIEGIHVEGLGDAVHGGLRIENGELLGKLEGRGLELRTVSSLLGLSYGLRGTVDLDMSLERAPGGRRGHLNAKLHDGGYLVVNGVQAELSAVFDGDRVTPSGEVRLVNEAVREGVTDDACGGTVATVGLDEALGALEGPLLSASTWREATGWLRVKAKAVKLRCVAEVWQQFNPTRELPFKRIDGLLDASVVLAREANLRLPSLHDLVATTTGLVVEAWPAADAEAPGVVTDRLDVVAFGALDARTGASEVRLHVLEALGRTDLGIVSVASRLDLPRLLAGGPLGKNALLDMPLDASLRVRRGKAARFAALPEPARTELGDVAGDFAASLFVEGTLRDPSVALRLQAWELGHSWGLPTDVDVLASYHGGVGRLDAKVRSAGKEVAAVVGESTGNLSKRLFGATDERWTGWLSAKLREWPLETLPPLARLQIAGMVTGDVTARELGRKPRITAELGINKLEVGRVRFDGVELRMEPVPNGDGLFTLVARLPHEKTGGLTVRSYASLAWRDELIPRLDTNKPAGVHLISHRFPLATLEPLLDGAATRVDGWLIGEARVRYRELSESDAAVQVNMRVEDGELSVPGQELTEITATIRSRAAMILVEDLAFSSGPGKATGAFTARLDGLELTDVTGNLTAAADAPMPLVLEGVPLGHASGHLVIHYKRGKGEADSVDLSVADLALRLPDASTRRVQSLDDHADVTISVPLGPPSEEEGGGTGRKVIVTAALASAVITQGQARIVISTTSPIVAEPGRGLRGEIAVMGGELNLLGKIFRFERGLVRLREEEPGNPYVNVTAFWNAANGTVVYVDYEGLLLPLTQDKIRFRSTPPLAQDELLALLLLGEGGTSAEGGADRAAALSRGIAAAQFNSLLGDIVPGLSASFSNSDGYTGTTVVYQVSDEVVARATLEQAEGAESRAGGEGAGDAAARTSLSIDWRFAPNWLLRGTIGVGQGASSGLDVLYQFRY